MREAAARVLARVRAAADPRAAVETFGSCIYAPAHAEDVDVLVSGDDPARLAAALFAEARSAARAIGDATSDAAAIDRIADLAHEPPAGTTLVIGGDDDHTRGRYDGVAHGLLRELEALGAIRSWGRFDLAADGSWQHRITVPAHRAQSARELVTSWLALTMIDASLG